MEPFQILCSVSAVILTLYYFLMSTFDFWKSHGIRGPRPIPIFGNFKDYVLRKLSINGCVMKFYDDYKDEPLIGIFAMRAPVLIVKDPDLIKDILIKDFPTFADRGYTIHEKAEPMSQHLFNLEPKRWRPLRMKLSPIFTSRKLKEMFSLISVCADRLVDYVEKISIKNEPVECLEVMAKYTTDVIGTCAFGIEMNTMSNEDSEFRRIGRDIFRPPWSDLVREKIKKFSPWFYDILGHILPDTEITTFFMHIVMRTIDYREKNDIVRHDFIDMLRDLKKNSDKMGDIDFTDSLMVSQAFVFFAAGYETSSTVMTNTLYELALNQKIQNKLREEIEKEYAKRGDSLTYDNIKEMNYLDKVFKETLRKYPPLLFLTRKSTSSYTFNGVKASIPKDQDIWIPVFALQRDPRIYPEPEIYDPERFSEEAVQKRHPMFFLSFGDGPRNCIGSRFAIYQTKLGLVKILRNYKVEPCEKTEIPYVRNEETFVATAKNGIYLRITKINRS